MIVRAAATVLIALASACSVGNTSLFCTSGTPCVCDATGGCTRSCPDGHCSFVCQGIGYCNLGCAGGGCEASCRGTGRCTLVCPGGGCTMHCAGTGPCICDPLDSCGPLPDAGR